MLEELRDIGISPINEAFKAVVGQGDGDGGVVPEPLSRTLYLQFEIDEFTALAFNATLHRLAQAESKQINVIINCFGGDVECGLGMYDAIKAAQAMGSTVTATVRGKAMSMAAIILQAADTRRISQNSYFMVHQAWGHTYSHSATQLESQTKWWRDEQNRMTRLLAERSSMTTKELAAKIEAADWYLHAKDALKYGFVDVIE